jgi:hypothetical protein
MNPVLVMGCGMSGAAVAGELRRRGVPVLISDLGPAAATAHVAAAEATRSWVDPDHDPHFRPWQRDATATHYGSRAGSRLRVGGRSLYWRGIVLRLEDYALADWPRELQHALQDGDPEAPDSYAGVERRLAAWAGRHLATARNTSEISWLRRLRKLGLDEATPTPRAVRPLDGGFWTAYSPLQEIGSIPVLSSRILRALTRRNRGFEATLEGPAGTERVSAAAVVLATGAIENARLVSWLTGSDRSYPIVDHHSQGWVCVRPEMSAGPDNEEASILVGRDQPHRINRFLEVHRIGEGTVVDAWTMGEQLPGPTATVRFVSPAQNLVVSVEPSAADERILAEQRGWLRELSGALGIPLGGEGSAGGPPDFDAAMKRAMAEPGVAVGYRCHLGTIDHEACTLPLGGELVDVTGELRQLPGVFVAGPCLFPRAGAANPTLTTLALSAQVARQIHRRLT